MHHNDKPDRPLFSVITINHNNLEGLQKTVASVLGQQSRNYELIVIDGASDDGSSEYLAGLAGHFAVCISEKDAGIYQAMNKGLQHACGEFMVFMNSGDCFADDHVLTVVERALAEAADPPLFIYGDSYEVREDGKGVLLKRARPHSMYWYGMFTQHQSMIFSKKLLDKLGLVYDESYRLAADWGFVVRFLQSVPDSRKIIRMPIPMAIFDTRGASANFTKAIAEQFALRKELLNWGSARCLLLAVLQAVLNLLRKYAPSLYYVFSQLRSMGYQSDENARRK